MFRKESFYLSCGAIYGNLNGWRLAIKFIRTQSITLIWMIGMHSNQLDFHKSIY